MSLQDDAVRALQRLLEYLPGNFLETGVIEAHRVSLEDVRAIRQVLQRVTEEHSITVSQAAAQLGCHPSAVRQAIQTRRLEAVKRGHQHLIRPSVLKAFRLQRRGPAARRKGAQVSPGAPGEG